jgi:hypothetical protein
LPGGNFGPGYYQGPGAGVTYQTSYLNIPSLYNGAPQNIMPFTP